MTKACLLKDIYEWKVICFPSTCSNWRIIDTLFRVAKVAPYDRLIWRYSAQLRVSTYILRAIGGGRGLRRGRLRRDGVTRRSAVDSIRCDDVVRKWFLCNFHEFSRVVFTRRIKAPRACDRIAKHANRAIVFHRTSYPPRGRCERAARQQGRYVDFKGARITHAESRVGSFYVSRLCTKMTYTLRDYLAIAT
jgi:hypothetical protein